MPVPQGIISTSTGPVESEAPTETVEEIVEETTDEDKV